MNFDGTPAEGSNGIHGIFLNRKTWKQEIHEEGMGPGKATELRGVLRTAVGRSQVELGNEGVGGIGLRGRRGLIGHGNN